MRPMWDRLNREEQAICELICEGLDSKQIAAETYRTAGAVRARISRIFDKVGAESRLQLAVLLTEEKIRAESHQV
jgi:DNA-binding NarL/FixJ family response regulator